MFVRENFGDEEFDAFDRKKVHTITHRLKAAA